MLVFLHCWPCLLLIVVKISFVSFLGVWSFRYQDRKKDDLLVSCLEYIVIKQLYQQLVAKCIIKVKNKQESLETKKTKLFTSFVLSSSLARRVRLDELDLTSEFSKPETHMCRLRKTVNKQNQYNLTQSLTTVPFDKEAFPILAQ